MHVEPARHLRVDEVEEFAELPSGAVDANWVITSLVCAFSAANKVVVPCRLFVRPPFDLTGLHLDAQFH